LNEPRFRRVFNIRDDFRRQFVRGFDRRGRGGQIDFERTGPGMRPVGAGSGWGSAVMTGGLGIKMAARGSWNCAGGGTDKSFDKSMEMIEAGCSRGCGVKRIVESVLVRLL
jgi:hypothetical protein